VCVCVTVTVSVGYEAGQVLNGRVALRGAVQAFFNGFQMAGYRKREFVVAKIAVWKAPDAFG
jgi:hypothetical protein